MIIVHYLFARNIQNILGIFRIFLEYSHLVYFGHRKQYEMRTIRRLYQIQINQETRPRLRVCACCYYLRTCIVPRCQAVDKESKLDDLESARRI